MLRYHRLDSCRRTPSTTQKTVSLPHRETVTSRHTLQQVSHHTITYHAILVDEIPPSSRFFSDRLSEKGTCHIYTICRCETSETYSFRQRSPRSDPNFSSHALSIYSLFAPVQRKHLDRDSPPAHDLSTSRGCLPMGVYDPNGRYCTFRTRKFRHVQSCLPSCHIPCQGAGRIRGALLMPQGIDIIALFYVLYYDRGLEDRLERDIS